MMLTCTQLHCFEAIVIWLSFQLWLRLLSLPTKIVEDNDNEHVCYHDGLNQQVAYPRRHSMLGERKSDRLVVFLSRVNRRDHYLVLLGTVSFFMVRCSRSTVTRIEEQYRAVLNANHLLIHLSINWFTQRRNPACNYSNFTMINCTLTV